ncbi:hypothetical protein TKK_0015142 [Trichogramma kaykai]
MEQSGGISIISPPSITDNNAANNKVKSNGSSNGGGGGLAASTASRLMNAKEKLRVPSTTRKANIEELRVSNRSTFYLQMQD